MAFLTRSRALTRVHLAGILMLFAAASCILAGGSTKHRAFAFSHKIHVVDQSLECVNCHADVGRSDQPGMPAPDACSVCHEELDAQKPPEKHIAQLFDGETFRAVHAVKLAGELIFSHVRHATTNKDCQTCHTGIESNESIEPGVAFRMDECTTCHAQHQVADECSVCHREVRADVAPPSHAKNWKRQHGQCARWPGEETSDRCSLCHRESSCIQCHREEAPESHTVYWHQRGHGIASMIDRDSCSACHDPMSCDRCHRDTRPQSHVGNWGAPYAAHCAGCHYPLRNEGCAACHPNTQSHREAAPKPNDPIHVGGQNCRQCHGLTAPLPHFDNGDDCNACHR